MEGTNSIIAIAVNFFLVANAIGSTPPIVALLKDFDIHRQRKILLRESCIAFLIALFFQFFGDFFLGLLMIEEYAVSVCGGLLFFLSALNMIFPPKQPVLQSLKQEPLVVPIAIPLISGPGMLSIIMVTSRQVESELTVTAALVLAWVGITAVLLLAPYSIKVLGKRGLLALEQLMGMVLALIAIRMMTLGIELFVKGLE